MDKIILNTLTFWLIAFGFAVAYILVFGAPLRPHYWTNYPTAEEFCATGALGLFFGIQWTNREPTRRLRGVVFAAILAGIFVAGVLQHVVGGPRLAQPYAHEAVICTYLACGFLAALLWKRWRIRVR